MSTSSINCSTCSHLGSLLLIVILSVCSNTDLKVATCFSSFVPYSLTGLHNQEQVFVSIFVITAGSLTHLFAVKGFSGSKWTDQKVLSESQKAKLCFQCNNETQETQTSTILLIYLKLQVNKQNLPNFFKQLKRGVNLCCGTLCLEGLSVSLSLCQIGIHNFLYKI